MIRIGLGLIALMLAIVVLGGPAEAASILAAQASAVIALMDEAVVLGLILTGCVLFDSTAWPVLTGQKNTRTRRAPGARNPRSNRSQHPDA